MERIEDAGVTLRHPPLQAGASRPRRHPRAKPIPSRSATRSPTSKLRPGIHHCETSSPTTSRVTTSGVTRSQPHGRRRGRLGKARSANPHSPPIASAWTSLSPRGRAWTHFEIEVSPPRSAAAMIPPTTRAAAANCQKAPLLNPRGTTAADWGVGLSTANLSSTVRQRHRGSHVGLEVAVPHRPPGFLFPKDDQCAGSCRENHGAGPPQVTGRRPPTQTGFLTTGKENGRDPCGSRPSRSLTPRRIDRFSGSHDRETWRANRLRSARPATWPSGTDRLSPWAAGPTVPPCWSPRHRLSPFENRYHWSRGSGDKRAGIPRESARECH